MEYFLFAFMYHMHSFYIRNSFYRSFGLHTEMIDGHDVEAIDKAIAAIEKQHESIC